jgi:hypothetical protein
MDRTGVRMSAQTGKATAPTVIPIQRGTPKLQQWSINLSRLKLSRMEIPESQSTRMTREIPGRAHLLSPHPTFERVLNRHAKARTAHLCKPPTNSKNDSKSTTDHPSMTWEWQWECCQCGISMNSAAIKTCPHCCSHVRCQYCKVEQTNQQVEANRHQERTKKPVSSKTDSQVANLTNLRSPSQFLRIRTATVADLTILRSPAQDTLNPDRTMRSANQYRTGHQQTSKQQTKIRKRKWHGHAASVKCWD